MITELFQQALNINSPWFVKSIDFNVDKKQLDIHVDFKRGTTFTDPDEEVAKEYKAYDTVQKIGRHLNFFEHECYLHARVPRIKRDDGKVRMISTPWEGKISGLTLLFEALLIQLCKAMPVHNVSQLTGVSDHKIWRVLDTYIDLAKQDENFSEVTVIGMDETSIAKGHDYISLFVDLKIRKTLHISDGKDGARYIFLKNAANLTVKQQATREALSLAKLNLKSVRAMHIRETFQQIYVAETLEPFESLLNSWYYWATHSQLPSIIKVAKTIKNHWDGIISWKESQINNGILEGLNSVLQAAKRKARGYKKNHFKVIAYLLTGKLDFSKVNTNCLPTHFS